MKQFMKRILFSAAIFNLLIANSGISALDENKSTKIQQNAPDSSKISIQRNSAKDYLLGAGDRLRLEVLYLPELSGSFKVGPDGTVVFPRNVRINAEGKTIEEIKNEIKYEFSDFVKDPSIYINVISYRPVRIYITGEVQRPGYYALQGAYNLDAVINNEKELFSPGVNPGSLIYSFGSSGPSGTKAFPTVYDAIRKAQGVTSYADLTKIKVKRKMSISQGGGRLVTELNFLPLITEGDDSENIRLMDGDSVIIKRSAQIIKNQIIKARLSNLSPEFLQVFVSGRVSTPGPIRIPQGAGVNQAIAFAGGPKLLRGKVEFVRFSREGDLERRLFSFNPKAPLNTYANPILMPGDVIRVRDSVLSATTSVLTEVSAPIFGGYSLYSLFGGD
tara:strand:- start:271 stop:1437 length:1167 start_codon:yes stop_codon:yes gene_type:complete